MTDNGESDLDHHNPYDEEWACVECGVDCGDDISPSPYCTECWVRFTPEGFYGTEDY